MKKHESTPAGPVAVSVKLEKVKGPIPKMRRVPGRARLTPETRKALRRVSYHESGHLVALLSFGRFGLAQVRPTGLRGWRAFTGWVSMENTLTAWQAAVMGWAGPLAETVFDERGKDPRKLLGSRRWLRDHHFPTRFRVSETDLHHINRYSNQKRTFLAAARVLHKWLDNVELHAWLFYAWAHTAEERPELVVRLDQP